MKMFYFLMHRFNIVGAKNMTLPVDETNDKSNLRNVQKKELTIGDLIVSQTFEMTNIVNNKIVIEDVTIHGGETPMVKTRQKMLEKHICHMR